MSIAGSCLCERVRFRIDGPLYDAVHCHCSMCRKYHGAAFKSRARVRAGHFQVTQGNALIHYYESSSGEHKGFCRNCGSPIVTRFDHDQETVNIALGTLDDDPGIAPARHIFVESKAPWYRITDALPQHKGFPS